MFRQREADPLRVPFRQGDRVEVKIGQPADVRVDSFPGRVFPGKVRIVSDRAEFTPRQSLSTEERANLVFGVEVAVENPEGVLKPGMPADVTPHGDWADSLCFSFGERPALRDVTLAVQEGEIFGLVGPDRAGKTTLIRLLTGVLRPASGRLQVLGADRPETVREKVGVIPQAFSL